MAEEPKKLWWYLGDFLTKVGCGAVGGSAVFLYTQANTTILWKWFSMWAYGAGVLVAGYFLMALGYKRWNK